MRQKVTIVSNRLRVSSQSTVSLLLCALIVSLLCALSVQAQEIKQSVIAGGGGVSENGSLRVEGTIGQSVVGTSNGALFKLEGGFWFGGPVSTPTVLAVEDVAGTYGGTITLQATLTTSGIAVNGKIVSFSLNGTAVGSATTGADGLATLDNVSLNGINAGTYPDAVTAQFAGDSGLAASNGAGQLTVGKANPLLQVTGGTFTYDGQPHPATASLTGVSNEALSPLTILYNGSSIAPVDPGTYSITASFPGNQNYNAALHDTATVIIQSAPVTGEFGFSQSNFNQSENGGVATITVLRSNGSSGPASVSYRTETFSGANAATEGADYNASTGTLAFAAGETQKTFSIAITNDTLNEADELVSLVLSDPTTGTILGTQSTATLTIVDDDGQPTVAFGAPTFSVNENNGVATITLNRISGGSNAFTVNFSTADLPNGATAGDDYTAIANQTLSFAEGENSKTFTITILDDTLFESNEGLNLQLSNPSAADLASQSTAVLTINDDDSQPSVQFSSATYRQDENGTFATITIVRSGGSNSGVSVQYATSNGSATSGADYSSASGTISFGAGETEKTFTVAISEDSLFEGNETIQLTLSNAVGASLGAIATAELTITDNDGPPVVQLSSGYYTVAEGVAQAVITVTRTGGSNGGITVAYATTNGTAGNSDYSIATGVLTFDAGETSKTFVIPIADDLEVESSETVNIEITNAGGGALLGAQTQAVLTITDNDTAACAGDVTGQLTITRGGFSQNFVTKRFRQTVTIKNTSGQNISGPIAFVVDGLSTNAALYNPLGLTTCAAPLNSPYVSLNAGSDNVLSAGETITVVLEYTNANPQQSITYVPRVLAGPGAR
jgi:hypothetical protein